MTIFDAIILFLAAVLAGGLNSVAGGGSFISFPMLIFTGVPPIAANATSTVAVWPGNLASATAYRHELTAQRRIPLLAAASIVGGLIGAELLLRTPPVTFLHLIPYLLLGATLLFAFGRPITARLRSREVKKSNPGRLASAGPAITQFIISVYGGYFGGGMGIVMLAAFSVMGMENVHEMNALKTILAACIKGIAVVTFVVAGAVFWPQALVMVVGAIIGGYGGAHYARKLDPALIRRLVIVVGFAMTIYFFIQSGAAGVL